MAGKLWVVTCTKNTVSAKKLSPIMLEVVLCTLLNNNMLVATVVVVLYVDKKATLLPVVEMEEGKMRIRSRLNKVT